MQKYTPWFILGQKAIHHMRCKSCETEMEGNTFGYDTECGDNEYYEYRCPLPLKCPECGIYDWKHDHILRWCVFFCKNESCKDPDVVYFKDGKRWFDYSRIPLALKGWDGPKECDELERQFGTSDRRALIRLGKKLKMKEIEKRTKGLMKIRNN